MDGRSHNQVRFHFEQEQSSILSPKANLMATCITSASTVAF